MKTIKIGIPLLMILSVVSVSTVAPFVILKMPPQNILQIGTKVPEFKLPDQSGKLFDIKDVLGRKFLVIYFYPKDDSPGCTREACTFRDQYEDFVKADAIVIGISSQSVESHVNFVEKYKLPFTLLSDTDNKVHDLFGVQSNTGGRIPGRVTFVIDKSGTIIYTFNSLTEPVKHVEEALKAIKAKAN
jgi:thioredoxin-dependent peroxiredoxin